MTYDVLGLNKKYEVTALSKLNVSCLFVKWNKWFVAIINKIIICSGAPSDTR